MIPPEGLTATSDKARAGDRVTVKSICSDLLPSCFSLGWIASDQLRSRTTEILSLIEPGYLSVYTCEEESWSWILEVPPCEVALSSLPDACLICE
jgi:hypothetical protein